MDLTLLKHAIGKDHVSQKWILFDQGHAYTTDGLVTLSMPSGLDIGEKFAVESKTVFKAAGYEPHVDTEDGSLGLTKGASIVRVPFVSDPSIFEALEPVHHGHISAPETFLTLLERIAPAISKEETRHYLNGVLFHYINENVGSFMVATDGHRLHYQRLPGHNIENLEAAGNEAINGEGSGVIVPRRAVEVLLKLKKPVESYTANAETITFWLADGIKLTAKTVRGTFPNWRRIVPIFQHPDGYDILEIDRKAILDALKEHKKMALSDSVTLRLEYPDLYITSRDPDGSECVYRTRKTVWGREYGFEVIYTRSYLEEIAKNLPDEGEMISMHVSETAPANDPAEFGDKGGFVLMPRRH